MAVDRKLFDIAKKPAPILVKFFSENFQEGYTIDELYERIPILSELSIPINKITETLEQMVTWDILEMAFLKGEIYYILKQNVSQKDIDEYILRFS